MQSCIKRGGLGINNSGTAVTLSTVLLVFCFCQCRPTDFSRLCQAPQLRSDPCLSQLHAEDLHVSNLFAVAVITVLVFY